jgi:chaperone modulatory protein CbpM
MADEIREVSWMHAEARVSINELAQCSGLTAELIRELVEFGALEPIDPSGQWQFSAGCVARVRAVARLRSDLELDAAAIALALAYLARIESLEARVRELDAQLARPRR